VTSNTDPIHKTRLNLSIDEGTVSLLPKNDRLRKKRDDPMWYYLGTVGEIGFIVAIPIAIGIAGGVFLDNYLGTHPKATLSLTFFGLGISMMYLVSVVRMVK
jgi:predicted F0F1-ATPase subunit